MTPSPAVRQTHHVSHHVSQGVLLTAVVLVALNLRVALSSLPTVITDIQDATGWSDSTLGVLTTIPVLCMGFIALTVPSLVMLVGRKKVVIVALLALIFSLSMRALENLPELLFVSAFLSGVGIALTAGVIPGIVRAQLPDSLGTANALWTTAMMASAAMGGALTVPIAIWLDSWSLALAFWALPAVIALLFWFVAERNAPNHDRQTTNLSLRSLPWRNPLAWALTMNMAINSIVFYSSIAWIAPSFVERGLSQEDAGWLFGAFTGAQVVSALVLAGISTRIRHRRTVLTIAITSATVALVAIGWAPSFVPWITLIVFGFFISGAFAMLLGLLSEYSVDAPSAARLTAMAFFITYTIGAFGPFFSGVLLDVFNSWSVVFTVLAVILITQVAFVPPLKRNVTIT